MSIIERAIDKLASDKPKKRKPVNQSSNQQKTTDVSASLNNESLPELDESLSQQFEAAPDTSITAEQKTTRARNTVENKIHTDPDILISGLEIEGVLSPKGGRSRLAEEYRLIKRPLLVKAFSQDSTQSHSALKLHNNVIMLTSSVAGEGKTFTSLNLAISIAMEMDQTVLLIDSDLAKPGLSKMLNIRDKQGLTDHLSGQVSDVGNLFCTTDIPKLTVLSAGTSHSRSTELLASRAMEKLLDELAQRYSDRIIIFDSPPLLATTESVVLSRQMGQICMVVESAVTPQYMVKQAIAQLDSTDTVSLILNKVKPDLLSAGYGYGYGYGKGYGESE